MCYRSKIWFILSNLYHDLLAFSLFKKGSHQRSLFYREEKYAMSLVLAEHLYSIKLFFKYQICLAIKKELDINQVLFHFIQYLLIAQVKKDIYTKNKYILILQLIILKRKVFCQFFYCKFNKTTYCTIRLICHKDANSYLNDH